MRLIDWISGFFRKKPEITEEEPKEIDLEKIKEIEARRKAKLEKRRLNRERLDRELMEDVKKPPTPAPIKIKPVREETKQIQEKHHETRIDWDKEARKYTRSLIIHADVKRVRITEWINDKKRVALNKEREVRHTHKGGWSQEKFQRFVKSKKKTSGGWIIEQLNREGVLRPPYDIAFVECKDDEIYSHIKAEFSEREIPIKKI